MIGSSCSWYGFIVYHTKNTVKPFLKIKKFFSFEGCAGDIHIGMLDMRGQPARADSFLFSSFPDGRGLGSALTGETHGERTENIIKQDFPHLLKM
jgi:hypothetical protein